jgi:hypothetical protein
LSNSCQEINRVYCCGFDHLFAVIIYLEDRRFQLTDLAGQAQHVIGGLPLLALAVQKIAAMEADWPLAVLELLIALVLLLVFIRNLRSLLRKGKGHSAASHTVIGWFDMAAGALLIFEAFHEHHTKAAYLRPPFFAGVVTIVVGLVHSRLQAFRRRRRYLKLDANGLECRPGPFRRFAFAWASLTSVEVSQEAAIFRRQNGQKKILRLSRYHNRDGIRDAVADQARAAGVLLPLTQASLGVTAPAGKSPE